MKTPIRTNSMRAWMLAARPKTLTGAAVPVMLGWAVVAGTNATFRTLKSRAKA